MSKDVNWLSVQQFIACEARYLDDKDWDKWLNLYHENAEYCVPAWDDDGSLTTDPQKEISLIYYANRGGLEDRVFRIRTGKSSASTPEMRTTHLFTLLDVQENSAGISARTSWQTHSVKEDAVTTYFGWAEYDLEAKGETWQILRKRTVVQNDMADTVMDIYSI